MRKQLLLALLLLFNLNLFARTVRTISSVSLRSWISGRERILCTLPPGTLLEVIDMGMSYGKWTVVRYKEKVGLVETKKITPNH